MDSPAAGEPQRRVGAALAAVSGGLTALTAVGGDGRRGVVDEGCCRTSRCVCFLTARAAVDRLVHLPVQVLVVV